MLHLRGQKPSALQIPRPPAHPVILTNVRTQGTTRRSLWLWLLPFVRTGGIGPAEIPSILPCEGRWQRMALTEG